MDYARADAKAAARERFHGIWAAINTPFAASGGIDEAGLAADLDRLAGELEVQGVFCTGVMSEFWALSTDERKRMVERVVDGVRGRCRVIAHTGHTSVTETIELTRHAERAGADFAVIINPYYPPASDEALYEWFDLVCRNVDIGVWLFDTAYAGFSLSRELLDRLADIENICGVKVGHGHAHYLDTLALVGDRIMVCEPDEGSLLEDIRDHGAQVFMSSAAPYLYQRADWRPMREYVQLALAGEYDRAAAVSAQLDPVRRVAATWLNGPWKQSRVNPIPYIKAWSGLLGMYGGPVRPPLRQADPARVARLAADLQAAGVLVEQIPVVG
jgi:4-hydroxy-tetrahydrodipicolinate synthase